MFVCAAPEPMHLDTLRQLMAINLETGDFLDDEMVSGESLLTSGVGLLAVNPADQLVAPVHDSIRTYMFSKAAMTEVNNLFALPDDYEGVELWSGAKLEQAARFRLGKLCLLHIQKRTTGQMAALPTPMTVSGVPSMILDFPTPVQRGIKWGFSSFFPRASKTQSVGLRLPPPQRKAFSKQDGFLRYAIQHWVTCTEDFHRYREQRGQDLKLHLDSHEGPPPNSETWSMFIDIAIGRNDSWNLHPWPVLIPGSTNHHLSGMFAFSVAHNHVPLLLLVLDRKKNLPRGIFDALLQSHGHLPALQVACKAGHTEVLTHLLKVCRLTAVCPKSRTPLHYAAEHGHLDCVQMLLSDQDLRLRLLDKADKKMQTALHLATTRGHMNIVRCLVENFGANTGREDGAGASPSAIALKEGHWELLPILMNDREISQYRRLDESGLTALMRASRSGDTKRVVELCHVSDLHQKSLDTRTALSYAIEKEHLGAIEALLKCDKFNPDEDFAFRDDSGNEFEYLQFAMKRSCADVVCALMHSRLATQAMMKRDDGWLPIEATVFDYHFAQMVKADRVNRLKAIVGHLATAIPEIVSDTVDDFHICLQSAAEVGHIEAVANLLQQWKAEHGDAFPVESASYKEYIQGRGLDRWDFETVCTGELPFPVAIYLAAMWQHDEVLALLLTPKHASRVADLMKIARQTKTYPLNLSLSEIEIKRSGGWIPIYDAIAKS